MLLENGVVDGMEPDNALHISFDEMSHDVRMYTYTVQMMNGDLLSSEYLRGFTTRDITDYEHSINTSREYTHYWFDFPNEDMAITKSGNYRLTIYEDGNPDNRVAEVDFCVVEPMVKIDTKVRANTDIEFNGRYQQVDVDVDFGIDRVYHEMGDYHALLFPNEITKGQYIHEFDSDGRFVVNAERTNDSDTEAEYMWVYWTLPAEKPWFDGMLYVGGEIFGNELSLRNRMQYDAETKCYWLTALVKQGGYDYQYWFVPKVPRDQVPSTKVNQSKATLQRTDGSYWQTENEYAVYVYWRPFGARYDRLIGVQIQKSTL